MGLKPVTTHWFEVLVAGGHVARAAEVLARTGRVQIESADEVAPPPLPELTQALERFGVAARRYGPYWPCEPDEPPSVGLPQEVLADGIQRLDAWVGAADPMIEELQGLEHERDTLDLVVQLLAHGGEVLPDLALLRAERNTLTVQLLARGPDRQPLTDLPPTLLRRTVETPDHVIDVVVAAKADADAVAQAAEHAKARHVVLPDWLPASPDDAVREVRARRASIDERIAALWETLDGLRDTHDLCRALNDIRRLEWYATRVSGPKHTRNFAVLTGWTDDPDGEVLRKALAEADLEALLHFPAPPVDKSPPIIVRNPTWARPFEVFSKMLGVPSTGEVDPAIVLSFVAPLLFGYMFGDVGQGLVFLVAGVLLRKRYPATRILIAGGVSAIVFGFLYGSLFTLEGIVPALWIQPMEAPLTLLVGSIGLGAAVLMLGLLLHGLSAIWRRQIGEWLRIDLSVGLVYVGVLGLFLDERFAWVAVAGAGWFVVAQLLGLRRGGGAALKDVGDTVEHLMRITVNTVSFVRVGAFALAHAGLSAAVASLAEGVDGWVGKGILLVIGNLLVLVLEGMVVSIQTTRLILFEFFVRFLKAEGRPFQPLAPPPMGGTPAQRNEGSA